MPDVTAPTLLHPPNAAAQRRLVILVYGTPAPQGSKRHVGHGVMVESSAKVKPWRADVRQAALEAMATSPWWEPAADRLLMHVTFALPRPRSHYRTGKFAHLLRDNAPAYHATKPDIDKLIRSTCDALTSAGVYADDSRVCQVFATKVYPSTVARYPLPFLLDRPGALIVLSRCER